jgi:hypothetical protein
VTGEHDCATALPKRHDVRIPSDDASLSEGRNQAWRALSLRRDRFLPCARPDFILVHVINARRTRDRSTRLKHAVFRKRAGSDRGVAGAGDGVQIGVRGARKPRAFGDEPFQAGGPFTLKMVHVVGAHLIDDDQHRKFRWIGRSRRDH